MENYSLESEHGYMIDRQGGVHYIDGMLTENLILYSLTREYPFYSTITIESGTQYDDVLSTMSVYGVFLDNAAIARDFNFESRIVIVPFDAINIEDVASSLSKYLIEFYSRLCNDSIDIQELSTKRPKYIYFDGLTDYLVYRKIQSELLSQPMEKRWNQCILMFVDKVAYQKNVELIHSEQLLQSSKFFLKTVNQEDIYYFRRDDPLISPWCQTRDIEPLVKFNRLINTYKELIQKKETYFVFTFAEGLDNTLMAAFAAAFITHGKKSIMHVYAQDHAYEEYIFQFSTFDFGSIEQRISRLRSIGVENAIRVGMSKSKIPEMCVIRDIDYEFTYKVVELPKLLSLLKDTSRGYIYCTDADDFDSCGKVYQDCFDLYATDEDGEPLYSLQPVLETLGIPYVGYTQSPDYAKYTEFLYRVLRLVDQFVTDYNHFTTLRDLIVIQGPETSYIGVGKLNYQFRGDILSLGKTSQHILKNVPLPTELYDHRVMYDFGPDQIRALSQAYLRNFKPEELQGFTPMMLEVEPLDEDEVIMALYWACNDELAKLNRDYGISLFELLLANTFNYRVHKYLYPKMFTKGFKPFGFREFESNKSPLNIFGGFQYQISAQHSAYVRVYQEAFRTFPGRVRRVKDNGVQN